MEKNRGCLLLAALTLSVSTARAQSVHPQLHAFGPDGSPTERRMWLTLEGTDGTCVDAESLTVRAVDAALEIEVREIGVRSHCVLEVRIHSEDPIAYVTLEAHAEPSGRTGRTIVAMGPELGLPIHPVREGTRLRVRVPGAGDTTVVEARWETGVVELTRSRGSWFTGIVPEDALVGIVARDGERLGAAAIPGLAGESPALLLAPSHRAVPSGGVARVGAFLFVSDQRGRLSRSVPLSIVSERGRLDSLNWLGPGVATVSLTTESIEEGLDLRAEVPNGPAAILEIPITQGWPVRGTLSSTAEPVAGEPIRFVAEAETACGGEVETYRLAVLCGATRVPVPSTHAVHCPPMDGGEILATLVAVVDGTDVPLATHPIRIETPDGRLEEEDSAPDVWLSVDLRGGMDGLPRPLVGVFVGLRGDVIDELGIVGRVGYYAQHMYTPAAGAIQSEGDGFDHVVQAAAGIEIRPGGVELPIAFMVVGGTELSWTLSNFDAPDEVDSFEARAFAEVSGGARFRIERYELAARVGLWLGGRVASWPNAWESQNVRGFVEVSGALGL